jgi:predicted negative regulator of RcsB-dependent stress response
MEVADIWQIAITIAGIVITLLGVYGIFRYWQGKVDERLSAGSENFKRINEKCVRYDDEISHIKTDVSAINQKVCSHEKRLDHIEDKI